MGTVVGSTSMPGSSGRRRANHRPRSRRRSTGLACGRPVASAKIPTRPGAVRAFPARTPAAALICGESQNGSYRQRWAGSAPTTKTRRAARCRSVRAGSGPGRIQDVAAQPAQVTDRVQRVPQTGPAKGRAEPQDSDTRCEHPYLRLAGSMRSFAIFAWRRPTGGRRCYGVPLGPDHAAFHLIEQPMLGI
jgi:hypothetical protein